MNDRRLLLAVALAGVILLGWQLFLKQSGLDKRLQPAPPAAATAPAPVAPATSAAAAPAAAAGQASGTPEAAITQLRLVRAPAESLTTIDTERWRIVMSNKGAQPLHWVLKDYRRGDGRPVDLIQPGGSLEALTLRTGGRALEFATVPFEVIQDQSDSLARTVAYQAHEASGLALTVRYRFPFKGFVPSVSYEAPAASNDARIQVAWRSWKFTTETNESEDIRQARVASLLGEKLEQDNLGSVKKNHEITHASGSTMWTVLRSKYFATGFLFGDNKPEAVTSTGGADSTLGVRFELPFLGKGAAGFDMYVGPVDFWKLQPAGHDLTRLTDSGLKFLVPLNRVVLKFFTITHKFVPNYGLCIIVLSVLMRLVFYPLNHAQMRSMKKMQEIQPEMERIREKYAKDPEKLNREVLRLYKENNVNPFGGCLPILAQMPVFFALFNVLSSSIELRQAGFVGWITDLSAPDVLLALGPAVGGFPIHVLPLIMAGTMVWQQKLTPMDPRQAATGMIMPFVMLFIFYRMPSGLVLYWTVTNILTALQQMHVKSQQRVAVAS